jgi:hypothetical protein
MLKNYKSFGFVCELEPQILLAGNIDLIEKSELGPLKKGMAEIKRMLKALIKSLEKNPWILDPWNPCPRQASLGPSSPIKLEKNYRSFNRP